MIIKTETEISSAHFVGTTETPCKRLHGHNWKIEIEIDGDIAADGMVMDFIKIKKMLKQFDHMVLVPRRYISSDQEQYDKKDTYTRFVIDKKEYKLPITDVEYVDVPETTAECMARHFATIICSELSNTSETGTVKVIVWETSNSFAEGFAIIDNGELYID